MSYKRMRSLRQARIEQLEEEKKRTDEETEKLNRERARKQILAP